MTARGGGAGERGLPTINQARAERRRALVFGRVRLRGMPPHFWLWAITTIGVFTVIYWRVVQGHLESRKAQVMAKQRAVAAAIGPSIVPFRDKVERWAQELAASKYPGDFVMEGAGAEPVMESSGVYLRLRLENARETKSIRKAATASLRDGFTSCLFRSSGPDPMQGPPCKATKDCQPGQLCNEWSVCAEPPVPFNMRLAYRTLRVLSNEWTDELHAATSELGVMAYERDLDSVTRHDVRIAADILARSKYFTLVLDEAPAAGLPAEIPDAGESPEERLQRTDHFARVGIWRLKDGKPILRLRAQAAGRFVPMGERVVRDPMSLAAQQRQVNSCELALGVRMALEAKK